MTVYIAGPMTGIPNYNFEAFFAAEAALLEQGYRVLNPARLGCVEGFRDWRDYWPLNEAMLGGAHNLHAGRVGEQPRRVPRARVGDRTRADRAARYNRAGGKVMTEMEYQGLQELLKDKPVPALEKVLNDAGTEYHIDIACDEYDALCRSGCAYMSIHIELLKVYEEETARVEELVGNAMYGLDFGEDSTRMFFSSASDDVEDGDVVLYVDFAVDEQEADRQKS